MIREASIGDIRQIQTVRNSVPENRLSRPELVTDEDCREFLTARGKGWVYERGNAVAGFAIVDLEDHNVWALFIRPEFERQGGGRQLHDRMLDCYFARARTSLWLGTAPGTRAEAFYRKAGWTETGMHGAGEIRFEMSFSGWAQLKVRPSPI